MSAISVALPTVAITMFCMTEPTSAEKTPTDLPQGLRATQTI